jgi:hypothetical protein
MTTAPKPKRVSLTPEQRMQVAFAVIYQGLDQHTVAAMFGVNAGRVAETVQAVRIAIDNPKGLLRLLSAGEVDWR